MLLSVLTAVSFFRLRPSGHVAAERLLLKRRGSGRGVIFSICQRVCFWRFCTRATCQNVPPPSMRYAHKLRCQQYSTCSCRRRLHFAVRIERSLKLANSFLPAFNFSVVRRLESDPIASCRKVIAFLASWQIQAEFPALQKTAVCALPGSDYREAASDYRCFCAVTRG